MPFPCPACRQPVFNWRHVMTATSLSPATCPQCGRLAGPSWWNALVGLALTCAVLAGTWYGALWGSRAMILACIILYAACIVLQVRLIPLAVMDDAEVRNHRIGFAIFAVIVLLGLLYVLIAA
jgi:hypothetical protein